jgi:hypothetical protein
MKTLPARDKQVDLPCEAACLPDRLDLCSKGFGKIEGVMARR